MTHRRIIGTVRPCLLAAALAASTQALGAFGLPGGDSFLDGSFAPLTYGASGNAYVTPLLFVGDLASTQSAKLQVQGTALQYDYSFSGLGTSLLRIDYTLRNTHASFSFTDLRFMLNVQPDGSGTFMDIVQTAWGAKAPLDADARQVVSLNLTLSNALTVQIPANNGLVDGSIDAGCAGATPCDADFGLQWNRASLGPGEVWSIHAALSDDAGAALSQRFLRATSADTANTVLTVSAVPEPESWLMFVAGLALIIGARRRMFHRRA